MNLWNQSQQHSLGIDLTNSIKSFPLSESGIVLRKKEKVKTFGSHLVFKVSVCHFRPFSALSKIFQASYFYMYISLFSHFRSSGVTLHDTCNRDHISSAVSSSRYCQPVKKIVRLELPSNVSFTQVCDGVSDRSEYKYCNTLLTGAQGVTLPLSLYPNICYKVFFLQ